MLFSKWVGPLSNQNIMATVLQSSFEVSLEATGLGSGKKWKDHDLSLEGLNDDN